MRVRRRRGIITLGPYELDVGALAQVFARPGCWLVPLILLLLLVVVGVTRPWELLRGRGAVAVIAPADAVWTVGGVDGRGTATVPVRGGRQELRVAGEVYFPRTTSVQVTKDFTTTVVLVDALEWLATASYTATDVTVLWPRPVLLSLPTNVRHLAFTGRGSDLVYEAKEAYGDDWRAYVLADADQARRLAWVEAIGERWAVAADGRVAYARGGQIAIAADLAHSTTVYTSSLNVLAINRVTAGWVVVLDEGYGAGRRLVWVGDEGTAQDLVTLGKNVSVVAQVEAGLLVRLDNSLYLLREGEVSYLGDTYAGEFAGVCDRCASQDGYIYWVGHDLSGQAEGEERAVWRAALPGAEGAVPVGMQVTAGVDIAGILGVRQGRVYYVFTRAGELYLARKNADGGGSGEVLLALTISGTEIWPGPDLQRWVVYDQTSKRLWVADFGGTK